MHRLFIVHNTAVVQDDILPGHTHTGLCQDLLENHSADDSRHRQALLHSWVEGVKLDIPAYELDVATKDLINTRRNVHVNSCLYAGMPVRSSQ